MSVASSAVVTVSGGTPVLKQPGIRAQALFMKHTAWKP
jgi:hypothetical protein